MKRFPVYRQHDVMDCGPTCLRMIAGYYGKNMKLDYLRTQSQFNKSGVSLLGIAEAAESIGMKSKGVQITFEQLIDQAPLPAIIHWNQNHFVVVTPGTKKNKIQVADPAKGLVIYTPNDFCSQWISNRAISGDGLGVALLLEPTPAFFEQASEAGVKAGWGILSKYLFKYRKYFLQVLLALLLGSIIQLVFPFLTQSIVDTGVNTRNIHFITVILVAQLMLFLGRAMIEFIRSRLLLHISTRVNISILSDFWAKLMRLPISFFDTKQTGDILQRISDQHRIENFLTSTTLSTVFSIINLFIFSIVLCLYSFTIFLIFGIGSLCYFFWIRFFLGYRRRLDYNRFEIASRENSLTMQLISGMQEIKLNNAEHLRRWEWENVQSRLFKLSFRSLSINQYQQAGAVFINEGKNIVITFLAAQMVIQGQLTLGAMLAIQYIIGQLNSPVEQLIGFVQSAQDAKISLERLNEINQLSDEEPDNKTFFNDLAEEQAIEMNNLSFSYPGAGNRPVLQHINCSIPAGKVTAIVGMSGSGKTTLLKLLLQFYDNFQGEINVGNIPLKMIRPRFWRNQCGSVLQDGFIFNDSIARNIAVGDEHPNYKKLLYACKVANILSFIQELPLGLNTIIGADGNGISQGQKQRILIARAVYKDPQYIFLDEATNSLDANNEKVIMDNLNAFFNGRTVIVVAHRLSTVRNADNIIVLHEGKIVEEGTHEQLSLQRGRYYQLVKNQLELGN